MRKMIIAGLLAATLAPTMASAQNGEFRGDRRDIRQDRDDRRDLRNDRRESRGDWRDYRRSNPGVYRGAAYVGPRGYAYRPVNVGYRFDPVYYDRRYWIDPYRYHLGAPGRNQQWVRYGRDVVRVDIRSGRTLEILGGFFF